MTFEEAKNLPIGTLVRWIKKQNSFSALAGATAKVKSFDPRSSVPLLEIEFIRDGLDNGQFNGGYPLDFLEVATSSLTLKNTLTIEEIECLSPGTLLRWTGQDRNYSAQTGAIVKFIKIIYGGLIKVEWIRNGLDGGQSNGDYLPHNFTLETFTMSRTQPCNCSTFDFTRFGCRYLQKADSKGFLHH